MGGKSGGPLSSWIREFTTLVFVQTVQAFVYAIIIVVIMQAMSQQGSLTEEDYISSVGLMAIFAITSLFKIEDLVKKIFGLGGTKADHQGAIKSIAKTAFALKLGKRVLDNGAKAAGGVKKMISGQKNYTKQKRRLVRDNPELLNNGGNGGQNATPTRTPLLGQPISTATPLATARPATTANAPAAKPTDGDDKEYYKKALEAKKAGDMDKYHENMAIQAGINKRAKLAAEGKPLKLGDDTKFMNKAMEAKKAGDMDGYKKYRAMQAGFNKKSKEIAAKANKPNEEEKIDAPKTETVSEPIAATPSAHQGTIGVSMGTAAAPNMTLNKAGNGGLDPKTRQKLNKLKDQMEDAKAERNKAIGDGLKDILSASTESVGAILGGTAGAILGGADGNLEEALQGLVSGAGIGDAAGEKTASAVSTVAGFTANRVRDTKKITDELKGYRQELTNGSNAAGMDKITEQIEAEGQAIKKAVSERRASNKKYNQAMKNIDKILSESNSSNSHSNAYTNSVDDT